jgi:hypothetical protein
MEIDGKVYGLGVFYGQLVNVLAVWSVFPRFGMLYQENLATLVVYNWINIQRPVIHKVTSL